MRNDPPADTIADRFIARWNGTERAERANYVSFLNELCDLLGVERPHAVSGGLGDYRFERSVTHYDDDARESTRRIDLYKAGCFILEAKQGANAAAPTPLFPGTESETDRRKSVRNSTGWAQHMLRAKGQAEQYARELPAREPSPPFLIVCDIGFCFDLYADFSGTGRHYAQFPDREGFRVYLADLRRNDVRERLATIWREPLSLDPARRRVEVTREIAQLLARLARDLERARPADTVATFLMRCVFCMFAQSVGLLASRHAFTELLELCAAHPASFVGLVGELWRRMDEGGYSTSLHADVHRFNGGLFAPGPHGPIEPLPLDVDQIRLLIGAAKRDWAEVEPAIFGTLLENALDPAQRGQLGAHFTPRAFVERLVLPTVMAPLRTQWDGFKAAADAQLAAGRRDAAAAVLREFQAKLSQVRVLDPACGTGNFLYVTMELMKRLEGEVLDALANVLPGEGDRLALAGAGVDPHQFLGLEKNPRAVPVAELVLWIGWLQWHFRTRGGVPPAEPILRDFRNIRKADALLDYREEVEQPAARWGGRTKKHGVTGEDVPDETHRVPVVRPVGAKPTKWPDADFVVGNPPFIAGTDMRDELGDGYTEALWSAYPKVPRSADIAMHFWWKAAQLATAGNLTRFGFITSKSITQVFCRRVVANALTAKKPLRLVFAVPNHPWSDGRGSAAVRIAMTVAEARRKRSDENGILHTVTAEQAGQDDVPLVELEVTRGELNAELTIGADSAEAQPLLANDRICSPGVKLHGAGFIISPATARTLGLGRVDGTERHVRHYLNGRDLTQRSRGNMVIDLDGLSEEEVRRRYPDIYQHVLLHVKPERDLNNEPYRREKWWLFGRNNNLLRTALFGLRRYIATGETARHRTFCFLSNEVLPDNMLVCIASDDAFHLGVLSSIVHVTWAIAAGGRLGVGNDSRYNKTLCFNPFPFPAATSLHQAQIRALAEELDGLRRTRLDGNPRLTMTGLYNVLEKLRRNAELTPADRDVHDAGHVSILRRLHDALDVAVADAYGWRHDLSPAEIVAHVVKLNRERRAEESDGLVRWLRPDFQAPAEVAVAQRALPVEPGEAEPALPSWPATEPERFVALRAALTAAPGRPEELARRFRRARADKVSEMLKTLAALGQARAAPDGRYQV